ncbi:hypothetical protein H9Q70_004631 [Fusarium xylarioides]|nr:hypothetical protein H9Q70_004631 [Fusarium xylarioides]KAG5779164.1 hypothetical protein H9Q73_007197 [Fusarium xylarioides]
MFKAEIYTIGWICTLRKEFIGAKAFLDVLHGQVDNAAINDDNKYTLGSIGKHNVVIAVLPDGQYGLVNAAAVLKDITRTFYNLRVVLMVGVGGGVPGKKDIRLGDIVVGSIGPSNGGVIQYDYGLRKGGPRRGICCYWPLKPAAHGVPNGYECTARYALEGYKRLGREYRRPEASTDRLYEAEYAHKEGEGVACSQSCLNDNLVYRDERGEDENNPAIHCGLIASGNSLIKDALLRDRLAAKHSVLCFEKEAAGLMNHFPNDEWQGYAAMAAAAYAKDLLLQVAPRSLKKEERAETVLRQSEYLSIFTIGDMRSLEADREK